MATRGRFGAFDISVFEKDEDDWFVLNVNIEKLIDAYEKIYKLFYDTPGCGRNAIYGDTSTGSVSAEVQKHERRLRDTSGTEIQ